MGRITRAATATLAILVALAPALAEEVDFTTPAERAGFRATAPIADTVRYLRSIEAAVPFVRVLDFGRSGAGRPMPLVVVDREGATDPAPARAAGRAIVLIQNGIHGGEIDGKDACLLWLRELAEGRHRDVLEQVTVLIVPALNVDGHEQVSPWNRPNQNGPVDGMGFRTNAAGLDLNRDHLKADSPEIRAVLRLIERWRPDLHVDDHVTDGSDHDWTLTYSWVEAPQAAPSVDAWLRARLPAALQAVRHAGYGVGPYVDLVDRTDPTQGFSSYVGRPWYATGYWPLRNRPSILIENLAYAPYEDRVRANHAFLAGLLRAVAADPASLIEAVTAADARTVARGAADAVPSEIVIAWDFDHTPGTVRWPVREWSLEPSTALGTPVLEFRAATVRTIDVPWFHVPRATVTAPRPRGYLILPGWPRIEERLAIHGLRVLRFAAAAELDADTFRVTITEPGTGSYQGRIRAPADVVVTRETVRLPAGTLWIPADQPDFEVAVQLLEPESPDSLFAWGFFASASERKEYIEPRILETWVREALSRDESLRATWDAALEDETLAADPAARWLWWYRRTPWWDASVGLLPVLRSPAPVAVALEPWSARTAPTAVQ